MDGMNDDVFWNDDGSEEHEKIIAQRTVDKNLESIINNGYLNAITEEKEKIVDDKFKQGFIEGVANAKLYGIALGELDALLVGAKLNKESDKAAIIEELSSSIKKMPYKSFNTKYLELREKINSLHY